MKINIINEGGGDLDVQINLSLFYSQYGAITVSKTKKSKPAELLVIMRCTSLQNYLDLDCPIHIYDYSKTINTEPLNSNNFKDVTLITLDRQLITSLEGNSISCIYSYHPVNVDFWKSRECKKNKVAEIVHIGNHKIAQMDDMVQKNFNEYVKRNNVTIYGQNWDFITSNRGPIPFYMVSKIYAKSNIAVGVMYDYQRSKTLSGRMWQGPINGCAVISEAVPDKMEIPGVIVTELNNIEIDIACKRNQNSQKIISASRDYWRTESDRLAAELNMKVSKSYKHAYRKEYLKSKTGLLLRAVKFYLKKK